MQFIIKRDKKARFKFVTLQSEKAQKMLTSFGEIRADSVLYLKNGKLYKRSTAALQIARKLDGLWPLLFGFVIIPPFFRNAVYDWIARNRYGWFGKKAVCMIPEDAVKTRFLGDEKKE